MPSRLRLQNTAIVSLQWGKIPPPNECPGYDTKQFDGDVLVILGFGGMRSTPLLASLPCPLLHGLVLPYKGSIYELNIIKSWTLDLQFFIVLFFFAFKLLIN